MIWYSDLITVPAWEPPSTSYPLFGDSSFSKSILVNIHTTKVRLSTISKQHLPASSPLRPSSKTNKFSIYTWQFEQTNTHANKTRTRISTQNSWICILVVSARKTASWAATNATRSQLSQESPVDESTPGALPKGLMTEGRKAPPVSGVYLQWESIYKRLLLWESMPPVSPVASSVEESHWSWEGETIAFPAIEKPRIPSLQMVRWWNLPRDDGWHAHSLPLCISVWFCMHAILSNNHVQQSFRDSAFSVLVLTCSDVFPRFELDSQIRHHKRRQQTQFSHLAQNQ